MIIIFIFHLPCFFLLFCGWKFWSHWGRLERDSVVIAKGHIDWIFKGSIDRYFQALFLSLNKDKQIKLKWPFYERIRTNRICFTEVLKMNIKFCHLYKEIIEFVVSFCFSRVPLFILFNLTIFGQIDAIKCIFIRLLCVELSSRPRWVFFYSQYYIPIGFSADYFFFQ